MGHSSSTALKLKFNSIWFIDWCIYFYQTKCASFDMQLGQSLVLLHSRVTEYFFSGEGDICSFLAITLIKIIRKQWIVCGNNPTGSQSWVIFHPQK